MRLPFSSTQRSGLMSRIRPLRMITGLAIIAFCVYGLYDHYRTQPHWDAVQAREGGPGPIHEPILAQRTFGYRLAVAGILVGLGLCVWAVWNPFRGIDSDAATPAGDSSARDQDDRAGKE